MMILDNSIDTIVLQDDFRFSSGGLSLRAYRCAVLSTGKSPDKPS